MDAPEDAKREPFVTPYFRKAQPDQLVVILKAREPARILVSTGKSATEQGHLEYKKRWVDQYNFYLQDRAWERYVRTDFISRSAKLSTTSWKRSASKRHNSPSPGGRTKMGTKFTDCPK